MQSSGRCISCSANPYSSTKIWHCSNVTDIPVLSLALLQLVNRSPTEWINNSHKNIPKPSHILWCYRLRHCSLEDGYQHFGLTQCLPLHGKRHKNATSFLSRLEGHTEEWISNLFGKLKLDLYWFQQYFTTPSHPTPETMVTVETTLDPGFSEA